MSFNASEHKVDTVDNVSDLGDVTITSATTGQYLKYNGGQWVNETPVVSNNNDVSITSPTANQILRYNGSAWINGDLSPFNIGDLGNVDTSALDKQGTTTDKYVLVWDASQQKYAFVNPDAVLSAAADSTTTIQPGLPQDFIDKLDDDLDNLIDVDAGSF